MSSLMEVLWLAVVCHVHWAWSATPDGKASVSPQNPNANSANQSKTVEGRTVIGLQGMVVCNDIMMERWTGEQALWHLPKEWDVIGVCDWWCHSLCKLWLAVTCSGLEVHRMMSCVQYLREFLDWTLMVWMLERIFFWWPARVTPIRSRSLRERQRERQTEREKYRNIISGLFNTEMPVVSVTSHSLFT